MSWIEELDEELFKEFMLEQYEAWLERLVRMYVTARVRSDASKKRRKKILQEFEKVREMQ